MIGHLRGPHGSVAQPGRSSVLPRLPAPELRRQAAPVLLARVAGEPEVLRRNAKLVKAFALEDCSGSEYGLLGDPLGFRFAAARSLLRQMRATGGGSMGVIHWGSHPTATLPLTDVESGFRQIDSALLADPGNQGGNDCPAALRMARQLLGRAGPDDIPLVFVITDGIEPVTAEMAAAVDALPAGCVHVLLVPGLVCDEVLAGQWQALALGGFERLPSDNYLMAQAVGSIYATAIGGVQPAARAPRRPLLRRFR